MALFIFLGLLIVIAPSLLELLLRRGVRTTAAVVTVLFLVFLFFYFLASC